MMPTQYSLLIVDDEASNLQKLQRTFRNDFQILQAKSGEEALSLLDRHRVDVIITDQRMTGISGATLLEQSLRKRPEALRIVLTGYTETDYLMDAINLGQAHRYVTKPWEPFTFRQTVLQDLEHLRLKKENGILAEQLRIAREVQRHLFPRSLPEIANLAYSGLCRTAELVGGDFYDFLKLSDEELFLTVGDVSGKGISAALLMAGLQASVRSHAHYHRNSLQQMLRELNTLMLASTDDSKFASMFCGVFHSRTRALRYVNAGHNPPLLVSPEDSSASRPGGIALPPVPGDPALRSLGATGPIVGMFPDARYVQAEVRLSAGDVLIVYTDGIVETFSPSDEQFGEERLGRLVRQNIHLDATPLRDRILEEVQSFNPGEDPTDDLTLVVLKCL